MAHPGGDMPGEASFAQEAEPSPRHPDSTKIPGSSAIGGEPKDPARSLLAQQAALAGAQRRLAAAELRHRRLQILHARIGIAFKAILLGLLMALLILLALGVVEAARSEQVVVSPFEVPDALAELGATGEVVASALRDELERLQAATSDEPDRLRTSVWQGKVIVQTPDAVAGLGEVRRYLFSALGEDSLVSGNIVAEGEGRLRLTVRGEQIPARSFSGRLPELPAMTRSAAEYLFGSAKPSLFLTYLIRSGRSAAAVQFAPEVFAIASTASERSQVAERWALALATQGRLGDARNRARLAIALDPSNIGAYASLIAALPDEERALAAIRWLRRRAAGTTAQGRIDAQALTDEHLLTQNWSRLAATFRDQAWEGGENSAPAAAMLALAEAHRHDHQAARLAFAGADPNHLISKPVGDLIAGIRELDLGRADRALPPLARFNAAWHKKGELRHRLRGQQCYLALARARLGRTREALQLLDASGESSRCRAFRGDVLALAGKWPEALAAYRRAIRRTPSLPVPWERAGAALLARGMADPAALLFQGAIQRAPHWADPRFGLAEALMRLGRVEDAEAQYRAAARFAPRWGALHIGWGDALWRLGRREEALAVFRAAARMDLSEPDRVRLQGILDGQGAG